MRAYRCINAAWTVQFAIGNFTGDLLIQRFAHTVQALELVLTRIVVLTGQLINRRQRMGVVGGELRVDQIRYRKQFFRTGQIGNVGVDLTGIDRITFQTVHLRTFDFAIPVGALNQTDHQATAAARGEVNQVVDNIRAALLVGLNNKADTVPARQFRFKAQFFQQIEGDLQSVGLFSIDIDTDVVLAGQQSKRLQTRIEFIHHAVILRAAITRMQRRQLDRNARPFIDAATI